MGGQECGICFDREIDSTHFLTDSEWHREAGRSLQSSTSGQAARPPVIRMSGFQPGLQVKIILETGQEEQAVLRWTKDNEAELSLLP
jgi:hypothetical protein